MIRFLSIRHLAIVDELDIEFEPGFNVLTGETGAGKSIIVGALGLLVGGRASGDLVRTGEEKAVVQATFESASGTETIVRREISARGRSRTFIDDALAAAATLKGLGQQLVDLHGQHEHQALLDPRTHVGFLDAYGGLSAASAEVADRYAAWRLTTARLEHARLGARDRQERIDLLTFQLGEIDRVAPEPAEDEHLADERRRLANADRLQSLCAGAYASLYERDDAVLSVLGTVWRQLDELATLDPAFAPHRDTRDSVDAPLDEIARFLRSYAAGIEVSPERLADVEARLAELERLKKKYGGTLAAVRQRRDEIVDELELRRDGGSRRAALEADEQAARGAYLSAAGRVSAQRVVESRSLAARLEEELAGLAIPDGRFEARVETEIAEERWSARGTDEVEFFISANPGEGVRPLSKVVSGGELSRVMLALKTLATTDSAGKTLVFDEVDAGVGGRAADRVGQRLHELGTRFQVLCVTHAPQLAAYATTHLHVSKRVAEGRTRTHVTRLSEFGRTEELARLMTGGASGSAVTSARELLEAKQKTKGERRKRKGESPKAKTKGRGNG